MAGVQAEAEAEAEVEAELEAEAEAEALGRSVAARFTTGCPPFKVQGVG